MGFKVGDMVCLKKDKVFKTPFDMHGMHFEVIAGTEGMVIDIDKNMLIAVKFGILAAGWCTIFDIEKLS